MDEKKLNELFGGIWETLTEEQKEKAKACKTVDELVNLAGEEGIELPDEIMDAVAGGYIFKAREVENGYEVINDTTGDVMASGLTRAEARSKAEELGQTPAAIDWSTLKDIRDQYQDSIKKKNNC